jgi:small subunit ribosomal protein S16
MLKIRMQRTGRKHQPTYRLVLTDSKSSAKSGKYLELLGNYDSRHGEKSEFKTDKILHWISVGAQVSPTVHNMLVDKKIITGKKINNLPLKKAIIKESTEVPAEPKAAEETAISAEETAPTAELEATPAEEVVA